MKKIKEAAAELRMGHAWVREKIKEGKIKYVRLGNNFFIPTHEIERIKKEGIK